MIVGEWVGFFSRSLFYYNFLVLLTMMPPESPIGKSLDAAEFIIAVFNSAVQLIDLRTCSAYHQWHLYNAINIDFFTLKVFENSFECFDRNEPIFIYCQTGQCSKIAKEELMDIGFEEAYDLNGGIRALKN